MQTTRRRIHGGSVRFWPSLIGVAALAGFVFGGTAARAQVTSTFDADAEGWRVSDLTDATGNNFPTFLPVGGNPGGFIRTDDQFSFNAFRAPLAYLGDKSAFLNGSLTLDLRVASSDAVGYQVVRLFGGPGDPILDYFATSGPLFPANGVFTTFTIPLTAGLGSGWRVAGQSLVDPPATQGQLLTTLSSLTGLFVDADWQSGADQVDLDNVRLTGGQGAVAPEPGTALLMLAGAGLGIFRPRRRAAR